jgi:hypothetical protein
MPGTPEERLSQVWELTQEVWSLLQGAHAEQRLQRDVAVLTRLEIPVISVIDLIANKRASGRAQDLADVEKLESATKRE